jgi:hypothetical protein
MHESETHSSCDADPSAAPRQYLHGIYQHSGRNGLCPQEHLGARGREQIGIGGNCTSVVVAMRRPCWVGKPVGRTRAIGGRNVASTVSTFAR